MLSVSLQEIFVLILQLNLQILIVFVQVIIKFGLIIFIRWSTLWTYRHHRPLRQSVRTSSLWHSNAMGLSYLVGNQVFVQMRVHFIVGYSLFFACLRFALSFNDLLNVSFWLLLGLFVMGWYYRLNKLLFLVSISVRCINILLLLWWREIAVHIYLGNI